MSTASVLFAEQAGQAGDVGVITLNRMQALNALDQHMLRAIYEQLTTWAQVSHIKAVVIRAAEGRAFCAGGDLRAVYEGHLTHHPHLAQYFREEYQLNRLIFHYPKPYIALLDGITMGGGAGLSINGSHRVGTPHLLFAMPETAIGFFPDVGGTYFLPRLKDEIGIYLGLTGARIKLAECVAYGLVQHPIERAHLPAVIEALAAEVFAADAFLTVTDLLRSFEMKKESLVLQEIASLKAYFSLPTVEAIIGALQQSSDVDHQKIAAELLKKSPTSLKVSLRALREGARLSFDECLRQNYRLASHFLQHHDFFEGIRALLIDKDQQPKWQPALLTEVDENEVEKYFAQLTLELD